MIPSPGRTVEYTLSESDAAQVNRRRTDARNNLHDHIARADGSQVHVGNAVSVGDRYPLVITRVWGDPPTEDTCVNGQVMLDGNDTLWVTSRQQGDGECRWREYPRV